VRSSSCLSCQSMFDSGNLSTVRVSVWRLRAHVPNRADNGQTGMSALQLDMDSLLHGLRGPSQINCSHDAKAIYRSTGILPVPAEQERWDMDEHGWTGCNTMRSSSCLSCQSMFDWRNPTSVRGEGTGQVVHPRSVPSKLNRGCRAGDDTRAASGRFAGENSGRCACR